MKKSSKIYLSWKQILKQIKQLEGSKYQNKVRLGAYNGREIVTFTDYEINEEKYYRIKMCIRDRYKWRKNRTSTIKRIMCWICKNSK